MATVTMKCGNCGSRLKFMLVPDMIKTTKSYSCVKCGAVVNYKGEPSMKLAERLLTVISEAKIPAEFVQVAELVPDKKDYERAEGIKAARRLSFHGPPSAEAAKMASAIKDPEKLIRRAKAVVAVCGVGEQQDDTVNTYYYQDCWSPFEKAMLALGFTKSDVDIVKNFKA